MRKLSLILMVCLMATTAMAVSLRQHQVVIVDEFGDPVTDITSVTISAVAGSAATIYADRAGTLSMTNPLTTSSTNTGLRQSEGLVTWFQKAPGKKMTVTNGTKTLTVDNMSEGDTRFAWYINYIGTAASLSVGDNETITVGTGADYVLTPDGTNMAWIPGADGTDFNIGVASGNQSDFSVFVGGGAGGMIIDEGVASWAWTGGAFYTNHSGANTTNIGAGTNTGAVNVGSSTAGVVALESTTNITVLADDVVTVTTSAGTIDLAATGGDITVDGVDSSVIIRGTEEAGDAVVIHADGTAGGIDITSGTGDVVITSTDDIQLTNATGAGDMIQLLNTAGTSVTEDSSAIQLTATAGGIQLQSDAAIDGDVIILRSDGGATSDILIHNDQGTGTDAIDILCDAGGITLTSASPVVVATGITLPYEVVAGTNLVSINENNKTMYIGHATEFTTTLPAVATSAGMVLRFVCQLAPSGADYVFVTDSNEAKIYGSVTVDGDVVPGSAEDTVTFTDGATLPGDWFELRSDGTNWYISGQGVAATSIVLTDEA